MRASLASISSIPGSRRVPPAPCTSLTELGIIRSTVYGARRGMAARVTRSLFTPAYGRLRESLVAARRARGLTQAELARVLDRPQSFVSKYERGERRLDLIELMEIAQVLRLDPGELVAEVAETLRLGHAAGETSRTAP